ncbi:hypothetical protein EDD69_11083 [Thermolongibacillus altinsuensis]|uniref:Uncharacterized protein n=1 Tax=Thermolongibacillus altinsuensis TaxID=575256 RepID=A0A4R1QF14_9BACL|nr:hypothetical protein [Thermolongibacillus altinsuensis]TCL48077.1 hypothetical protein EDD69_11083 [Thermolongibacillus altinsuensis]GMB09692.1 hypothetical protein B1no1_24020 [Thermolongibacillus altinsuensis]
MYRGEIGGKEVIIKLRKHVKQKKVDEMKIYQTVLSFGESAFQQEKSEFGIFSDKLGLIVASIEKNDIPVIYVDYLIQNENVYE